MTRILIVDDKVENVYYLQALLSGHGYDVDTAGHGAEALAKARLMRPDVVISDLLMPVMDGYTLLRRWRLDPQLGTIPFIVYTATYTEPEDEQLALSLGADGFILKPAEPEDFMAKLTEIEAASAAGRPAGLPAPATVAEDNAMFMVYSEALIRKLEEKMLQLEDANRELQLDIARRKEAEDRIEYLACYDPLTGLPNRRLMEDRLQHCVSTCMHHQRYGGMLIIDIDNFKTLNDARGHTIGDLFLKQVGARLREFVQEGYTVARFGGDEFVVILDGLSDNGEEAAAMTKLVADQILAALTQPYQLHHYVYHSTASIGISLFNDTSVTVEELISRADTAMYQAKRNGRNSLHFYDPTLQASIEARLHMENGLRRALSEDHLRLYYQPQANQHGAVIGAEGLIRWLCPERGLVPPVEFIPLAETTGLIMAIGRWVLETSCRQLKIWEADPRTAALQLAVNVSPRQFHQSDFVTDVLQVIDHTGINPARLKLELTESLVLDDINSAIATMTRLREAGVRFSMDDFGTGYSSLSYLTQLPLDQLKIDRSFVRNIEVKHVDAVIVQTIIGMARNLDMEVIAEGVETANQYAFLKQHGCMLFQGYHFGKPMPLAEFEQHVLG